MDVVIILTITTVTVAVTIIPFSSAGAEIANAKDTAPRIPQLLINNSSSRHH